MTLNGIVSGIGTATLANAGAVAGNPNKSFVNREAVASQDGSVAVRATRRIGMVKVGDFPSGIPAPANWSGYLLSMSGYQDDATSQAGSTTTAAPTAASPAGTVNVWNGTTYVAYSVNNGALNTLLPSATQTAIVNGHVVTVKISVVFPGDLQAATTGKTQTCSPSGSLTLCTSENSSITPFAASVRYEVSVDGGPDVVDLHIAINMGTMLTRSVYAPAPAAG